ncbi:Hermansky-Pudlak syndrome 4 protein isoform X2 [Pristis pectinata]|uniref:Hermansky-Pudlak syndrome 4 protein isoform X2 n=1 Tax=Pristis pectinata TaxID=685728 RepID=UPI00223E5A4C|nr:Hermansky-Pudlak syndrome 4 protein isoform X2 [Pristis pectinata]
MATAVATEQKATAWCSYFFLYDSSKVKEEGDPTSAGIYYFFPSQTTIDQQELLCGQVAGVVCCITEISGTPPSLIRLRKLKFAIQVDGEYLWALGCAINVPDVSCKHFLDQLIGVFTFYNGSSKHVYQVRDQAELARQWELYMEHIQQNSCGLYRTFNSLWNLDRTDVDPLLLLKAALILQSCQRCPEILAGCILYTNLIVSSQLPPEVTAKVLAYQPGVCGQSLTERSDDAPLPQDVTILPVFVTEEESAVLRQYSVEWMYGTPESPNPDSFEKRTQKLLLSRTLSDSPDPEEMSTGCSHSKANYTEFETSYPNSKDRNAPMDSVDPSQNYQGKHITQSHPMEFDYKSLGSASSHPQNKASLSSSPGHSGPSSHLDEGQSKGESKHFVDLYMELTEDRLANVSGCPTSNSVTEHLVPHSESSPGYEQKEAGVVPTLICSADVQSSPLQQHQSSLPDDAQKTHSATVGGTLAGYREGSTEIKQDASLAHEPTDHGNLVKLSLYVHTVKGLVMSLLAEDGFGANHRAIEDVYHSSLASLNGLEVHLSETLLGRNFCNLLGFNFAHYDCIQHILTEFKLEKAQRRRMYNLKRDQQMSSVVPTLDRSTLLETWETAEHYEH